MAVHFVLDQNFPYQAVTGVDWPPLLRLSHLKDIDPRLTRDHDDWQVLLRLAQHGSIDGFVTNDADMLEQAPEMVALAWTKLMLIITDGVGHDPIRATGLLMLYLVQIAKQNTDKPAIYHLRAGDLGRTYRTPGQAIDRLAQRQGVDPRTLIAEERAAIRAFLGDEAPRQQ